MTTKTTQKLTLFLTCLFTVMVFISCDKDDSIKMDPQIPQENEIKLLFKSNPSINKNHAFFYIKGENIKIDWGDETEIELVTDVDGYASHNYQDEKEYIITIFSEAKINRFSNFSEYSFSYYPTPITNISNYQSLSFGENVEIDQLFIQSTGVSTINTAPTTKINYSQVVLQDNWNPENFKNLNLRELFIYASLDKVDLNGLNITKCAICLFSGTQQLSLTISACPNLWYLSIFNYYSKDYPQAIIETCTVSDLPNLTECYINNLNINTLDLSKAGGPMHLDMDYTNVTKPILFDKEIKKILIKDFDFEKKSNIKTIDISPCENLEELATVDLSELEEIITSEKTQNLKIVGINQFNKMGKIRSLNFNGLAKLNYFRFDGIEKKDLLEKADFSNCPELEVISISNTNLSEIKVINSPSLKTITLNNNELPEHNLLDFMSSLPHLVEPNVEKRHLDILGNPGISQKVKEKAETLEDWSVIY